MLLKIFIKNINILPQLFFIKRSNEKVEKVEKGGNNKYIKNELKEIY